MARAAFGASLSLASRASASRALRHPSRFCGKIVPNCSRQEETSCWNCSDAVNCTKQFFCDSCHTIQPLPETQNLFEYMGLPVSFNIEDSLLKKRFRELQFKLHPDRFARASEHEKELSDEHSRRLNESYKTLSEPLHRAKYLLKILGDTNIADKVKDLDESSLMEMMEWHERIAEMTTKRELTAENEKLQEEIDGLLAQLGRLFEDKNLSGVRETITRLSYLYSVRNLIDQRKEAMFAAC